MRLVIDGYNLMHAMGLVHGPVGPHELTKARVKLIGRLAAAHGETDDVTLVFDARGAPAGAAAEETRAAVQVHYTLREEADDYIERRIAHDSAPARLIVVSNDKRLREAARRRGCAAWLCDHYLDWLERAERGRRRLRPRPADKPDGVPPRDVEEWEQIFGDADADS